MTEWAEQFRAGRDVMEAGRQAQIEALRLRCDFRIDGEFLRCSADTMPAHEHRHVAADLPGALADEERWKA